MNAPQPLPTQALGVPIVDTHCHVIDLDETRYPRAPMGGKSSDWSRERPVNAEAMVEGFRKLFLSDRELMGKIVKESGMARD